MGKASKNRAREKRKMEKRARKQARKQLYQQWALEGRNKKSKRTRLRSSRIDRASAVSHPNGPCGNIGCETCRGRRKVCRRHTGTCHCAAAHEARP